MAAAGKLASASTYVRHGSIDASVSNRCVWQQAGGKARHRQAGTHQLVAVAHGGQHVEEARI